MDMASKTNAVRIVEQKGFSCKEAFYEYDPNDLNGMHAANAIGLPGEQVFKTLVAKGARNGILVFCIPVCCELDLKKAAKAAGDNNVYFIDGETLFAGEFRDSCTVDGVHPNDLGFFRMGMVIGETVGQILRDMNK